MSEREMSEREMGERMDSFLMMGQSNMAGRGRLADVPAYPEDGRLLMLRCGLWQPLSEPVNPDRRVVSAQEGGHTSGVSLAPAFASAYAQATGRRVGLIPCAYGGSRIADWQEGRPLFDHAVAQAHLAQRSSRLMGILWHQGESDCEVLADVERYEQRFESMLAAFTRALGYTYLPVVMGQLGGFSAGRFPFVSRLNPILQSIAQRHGFGFASGEGLTGMPDGMHFDAHSQRVLGGRYYEAYAGMSEEARTPRLSIRFI